MSQNKLLWVLQSRKFWMSAIGLILILVTAWQQDPFPTDAVVTAIMGVVAAFVAATAYEDSQQAKATATVDAATIVATTKANTTTVTTPSENVTVTTADKPARVGMTGLE